VLAKAQYLLSLAAPQSSAHAPAARKRWNLLTKFDKASSQAKMTDMEAIATKVMAAAKLKEMVS
jgi:hypothetical protein